LLVDKQDKKALFRRDPMGLGKHVSVVLPVVNLGQISGADIL